MQQEDLTVVRHQSGALVSTLPHAFQETAALGPDSVAIRTVGDQVVITWRQYAERVRKIAAGLSALGVERGHTVGLLLGNRPEFHLTDTAAMHLGAIPFSIYNTSAPDQIRYLFSNAENKIVITEKVFLPAVKAAGADLAHVVVVDADPDADLAGYLSLERLESLGTSGDFDFDSAWRAVTPDDVATLIYTSGTTGPPKGVELTHANLMAAFSAIVDLLDMQPNDSIMSYLPHAHIADRVSSHYANIVLGAQVTDVDDPRAIAQALPDVRPTTFLGVPRVWNKIKAGLETKLATEATGIKQRLALWAIDTGIQAARLTLAGQSVPPSLAVRRNIADRLVLAKLRHALGLDQVRWAVIGAAPSPIETIEFVWGLGIPIYEVWGMSESVGCGTSARPDAIKVGSVGKVLSGVEISVAGDGELLIRGPVVMRGYRHQPEKTAEAIDADGWLHTGDIGTIDSQGFVTIVDRKKELLVNDPGLVHTDRPGSGVRRREALRHGTRRSGPGCRRGTGRRTRHGRFVAGCLRAKPRGEGDADRRRARGKRQTLSRRANQAVLRCRHCVGAGRRRTHPNDETQTPPDRGEVFRGDRQALRRDARARRHQPV
jgi:long-chain acyl-CoA synthetase